ncbi:hypothetical protein QY96_01574 [Bacillus thermotolerans]|nr:hypothetical protein QY96_01574 [Bacillus thermotolerans]
MLFSLRTVCCLQHFASSPLTLLKQRKPPCLFWGARLAKEKGLAQKATEQFF